MYDNLIKELTDTLEPSRVLLDEELLSRSHHIWTLDEPLKARALLLPLNTMELSNVMKILHKHKQAIVIHGGLTNLVGATETRGHEVVISVEKMNKIEEVDPLSRTMTVQAGVILEEAQNAAKEKELLLPLNFGAKGSAQIGGVISTNAGGLRVFRYGMTRNLVLGLEVVLADGTIISSMKKIIKDNSAYDLKHLFIGSEGTLGIVTKAVLRLVEAPQSRNSAFIGVNSYDQVVEFLKFIDQRLAGTLSGFELIWRDTYKLMTSPPAIPKPPLAHGYGYYILIESLGSDQLKDRQSMESLLTEAIESGEIEDAVMAHSTSDIDWFWKIREDVHVLASQCQNDQHFDISLPTPEIGPVLEEIIQKLYAEPEIHLVTTFGHVADGNIHLVVGKTIQSEEVINKVNDIVYSPLKALGGSVSAEHGIGLHKKAYLNLCRTEEEIQLMKLLKRNLDPYNMLNPGKVL